MITVQTLAFNHCVEWTCCNERNSIAGFIEALLYAQQESDNSLNLIRILPGVVVEPVN